MTKSMMKNEKETEDRICRFSPLHVKMLDNRLRRFFLKPEKFLRSYVKPGMNVIDIGCGPGVLTREIVKFSGAKGTVTACDVQEEMIEYARKKLCGIDNFGRIKWHVCSSDSLDLGNESCFDFAISFFMVHEVPDMNCLFREVFNLLKPGGIYLIAEPAFHVSKEAFYRTVKAAEICGFITAEMKKFSMGHLAVFEKPENFGENSFQGEN